jgi:uncharacterized small protein (DUF1192 family)
MAYRDHDEVLRAREQAVVDELVVVRKDVVALGELQSRIASLEAELVRIRSLLAKREGAPAGLLERLQIASPCGERWDAMSGDDTCRFCEKCGKNVYDVSAMRRPDAERFLVENTGACLRLFRRADGTVLTDDCPVGVRRKRRLTLLRHTTAIALGLAAAGAVVGVIDALRPRTVKTIDPVGTMGF